MRTDIAAPVKEDLRPKVNPSSQPITSATFMLANGIEVVLEEDDLISLNTAVREGGQVLLAEEGQSEEANSLLTPEVAAAILGVTRPAIYAWQDRNRLSTVPVGRVHYVPLQEVLDLRAQREANAAFRVQIRRMPKPTDEEVEAASATFSGLGERLQAT